MEQAAAHFDSVVHVCIIQDASLGISLDGMCCLNDPSLLTLWLFNLPNATRNLEYLDNCIQFEKGIENEKRKLKAGPAATNLEPHRLHPTLLQDSKGFIVV